MPTTIILAGLALALAAGSTDAQRRCNEASCRTAVERPSARSRRPEPELPTPNPNAARDAYLESRSDHSM